MAPFKRIAVLAALAVSLCFALVANRSLAADPATANHVAVSAALEAPAAPGRVVWLAIRQVVQPGWHTYWVNPGETGLPTSVSWNLPAGVSAGDIQWPVPQRLTTGPIVDYGYTGSSTMLVPLSVAPSAKIGAAPATATVSWLACAQMCVPESATIAFDLNKASGDAALFAAARAALPRSFAGTAAFSSSKTELTVTMTDAVLQGVTADNVQFFPATLRAVNNAVAPRVAVRGNSVSVTMARARHPHAFDRLSGVLALKGRGAFAIAARPGAAVPVAVASMVALPASPKADSGAVNGLLAAALMAFAGGLILNLMPCVLPILSMKAMALTRAAGDSAELRRDGVYYFIGVLATFGAIAATLLTLKAAGAAIGWGFQLQSPTVVLVLALLMSAIGLNLLGAFEVPLSLAGIGSDLAAGGGGKGAFFTGALAVLVASPCTAPFMGTALGYALTQDAASAGAVFLALGIGFALPFTALAFTPALVRLVPRPGNWMVRFKEFLAFPMFATAIWLLWVLTQEAGPAGLVWALSIGLGIVFLFWLVRHLPGKLRLGAGVAGAIALLVLGFNLPVAPAHAARAEGWRPWSVKAVAEARAEGRPVLVDFGAAWCVTCLVNERVALDDPAVKSALAKDGVVLLKGDWTSHDGAITAELSRFGRAGVPLYLLYPANKMAAPKVLPQILTPDAVLAAL
ncbi:MAG: thioredoxin family protein [Pseudomonadota bacterium]|nr:thioredoxin family protein [Pseudomonadota bacterium]